MTALRGVIFAAMCKISYSRCNYGVSFQAEDGIRDLTVTGVQTCALPILVAEDHRAETTTSQSARKVDVRIGWLWSRLDDLRRPEGVDPGSGGDHERDVRDPDLREIGRASGRGRG